MRADGRFMWYFWTQFWHKAETEKQEIGQKLDQNVKTKKSCVLHKF